MKKLLAFLLVILTLGSRGETLESGEIGLDELVIENETFRLLLGKDATVRSLIVKATGEEMLDGEQTLPLAVIGQNRTYDNEHQLTYPVNPRSFPANRAWLEGDKLKLAFAERFDIATIDVKTTPDYIAFTLEKTDFVCREGLIHKTPKQIDDFTFLQLPVRRRAHFGEWMNVMWDNRSAVALMGINPETHISSTAAGKTAILKAGGEHRVRLYGTGAVILADETRKLLDRVDAFERDYNLPRGVESRRRAGIDAAIWESRYLTPTNADKAIAYAREGGFDMFRVYYLNFAKTCGHYDYTEDYPNGLPDLESVVGKIRVAGMRPGFHIHYNKVSTNDAYVASATPDTRMASVRTLTLARSLAPDDTTLFIEEDPTGLRTEEGRRLVQIGREWVAYGGFTTTEPFALTNCVRGIHGSVRGTFAKGERFRLVDVDEWPFFIRLDQDTTLPDELAGRLAEMWNACRFEYLYFDGAEDIPEPYWYNVPRSQYRVWKRFDEKPLWAEGALKSHFGWHMLSRGNAFDHFATDRMREAVKKYFLPCARLNRDNFTCVNFGWINLAAPGKDEIGMRPEILEYLLAKATAFSSPLTVAADTRELDASPYTKENLAMIRRWQEARKDGLFTDEMRRQLEDPDSDFHLTRTESGWKLEVKHE